MWTAGPVTAGLVTMYLDFSEFCRAQISILRAVTCRICAESKIVLTCELCSESRHDIWLASEEEKTYSQFFLREYEYAYDMIVHCVYAFIEIIVEFGQALQSVANSLPSFIYF